MRGLIIDGWASPRSRQLQSAATSGSCPASSAALHSRAGGVAQRVPAPWLTSPQASSGRGPRGAGAGLMHSSLFLATAAALRTFCIRPSTGVCTFRAASYQSRPRRSRPSLACETSFAPSRDDTCAADVRPAPAPPAELPPRPNGIVVAYKPQNWTSFDVVAKARGCLESELRTAGHVFRRRSRLKVGHGGTLDPMAEGILVLGIGTGCRGLDEYLKGGKAYRATAQLGFETDTQDATGQVTSTGPTAHVTVSALQEAAARMVGTILQRPPIYSAIKRDGKRLHNLARAGKLQEADVEPRQVSVHALEVTDFDETSRTFQLRVLCGGGTYIRTLIVDLGRAVGSAAHMTALVRTQVGPFACEGTGAPGATVVRPVREGQFGEAASYYAAMAEAAAVLQEAEARRDPGEAEKEGGAVPADG